MATVVELTAVVVPFTNRLPLTVKLEPVVSIASLTEADQAFNSSLFDSKIITENLEKIYLEVYSKKI